MNTKLPVSAVILTLNEEKNIIRCVESLHFIDEIIVLDSGSTDATLRLLQSFPQVKLVQTDWKGFSATKQLGVSMARNEYILWIDADEEIAAKGIAEIFTVVKKNIDIGIFPRRTFLVDRFIKHGGWFPDYQKRLFKKSKAEFNHNLVHEDLRFFGEVTQHQFLVPINHYSFYTLRRYFEKQHRYGFLAAEDLVMRNKRISCFKVILNPCWAFIHSYIIKGGILEGFYGIVIAIGTAYSKFLKYGVAYSELNRRK